MGSRAPCLFNKDCPEEERCAAGYAAGSFRVIRAVDGRLAPEGLSVLLSCDGETTGWSALLVVLAVAGVLVSAALVAWLRLRTVARLRAAFEWEIADQILRERGFNQEDRLLLRAFLRRHSLHAPLKVLTTRRGFEACVGTEMSSLRKTVREEPYELAGQQIRTWRDRLGLTAIPPGQRIYSSRQLAVGQTLQAWAPGDSGGQGSTVTVCAVDEAYFHVQSAPDDPLLSLKPGDKVVFKLWREDDARYELTTRLIRQSPDPVSLVFLHATDLKRLQARQYYRVRHDQPAHLEVLQAVSPSPPAQDSPAPTLTEERIVNLSVGGVAVLSRNPLEPGTRFRMRVDVPDEKAFMVEATVVAVEPSPSGYLLRASFEGLSDEAKDALARYARQSQQDQGAPSDENSAELQVPPDDQGDSKSGGD